MFYLFIYFCISYVLLTIICSEKQGLLKDKVKGNYFLYSPYILNEPITAPFGIPYSKAASVKRESIPVYSNGYSVIQHK